MSTLFFSPQKENIQSKGCSSTHYRKGYVIFKDIDYEQNTRIRQDSIETKPEDYKFPNFKYTNTSIYSRQDVEGRRVTGLFKFIVDFRMIPNFPCPHVESLFSRKTYCWF